MEQANVRGDQVFYNTLVSGLMFNHHLKEASEIAIKILRNQGLRLNEEVYSNLISTLCKFLNKKYRNNNMTHEEGELTLLNLC